jgi:hypothetical protein
MLKNLGITCVHTLYWVLGWDLTQIPFCSYLKLVLKLEYPFGFFYSVDFTQNHFAIEPPERVRGRKLVRTGAQSHVQSEWQMQCSMPVPYICSALSLSILGLEP